MGRRSARLAISHPRRQGAHHFARTLRGFYRRHPGYRPVRAAPPHHSQLQSPGRRDRLVRYHQPLARRRKAIDRRQSRKIASETSVQRRIPRSMWSMEFLGWELRMPSMFRLGRRSDLIYGIEVGGNTEFLHRTREALTLLQPLAQFEVIQGHLEVIRQGTRSGMKAWADKPTFIVGRA